MVVIKLDIYQPITYVLSLLCSLIQRWFSKPNITNPYHFERKINRNLRFNKTCQVDFWQGHQPREFNISKFLLFCPFSFITLFHTIQILNQIIRKKEKNSTLFLFLFKSSLKTLTKQNPQKENSITGSFRWSPSLQGQPKPTQLPLLRPRHHHHQAVTSHKNAETGTRFYST